MIRGLALAFFYCSSAILFKAQDFTKELSRSNLGSPESIKLAQLHAAAFKKDTVPFICTCSVSPQVNYLTREGNIKTYEAIPNASCSGEIITTPGEEVDTCGVSFIAYQWSITSGADVAETVGSFTGQQVQVRLKKSGNYQLQLVTFVNCSDDSECSGTTTYDDTATVEVKECTCTAGAVTITPGNRAGSLWTYNGAVEGQCTGEFGTSPDFAQCAVNATLYKWSISPTNNNAQIEGNTDGSSVNVRINGPGPFTLRLDGTTICNDDDSCQNYNFYTDSSSSSGCTCNVKGANIQPVDKEDSVWTYEAFVNGECLPINAGTPGCNLQRITYSWTVSVGAQVAQIVGPADLPEVDVQILQDGEFTLSLIGEVICNDSTRCEYLTYFQDTVKKPACDITVEELALPAMAGGLAPFTKTQVKIRRDDVIALVAEALDFDQVKFTCTPNAACDPTQKPDVGVVKLNGSPKYKWKITGPDGNFVSVGFLPQGKTTADGERAILQPPYVPLPAQPGQNEIVVKIQLEIEDPTANANLKDKTVVDDITVAVRRRTDDPDFYFLEFKSKPYTFPTVATPTTGGTACPASFKWTPNDNLKVPTITLPGEEDKDKLILGQWIILEAPDQTDPDDLNMFCGAQSGKCTPSSLPGKYNDLVQWEWTIKQGGGRLVGGNTGRFVIYEASEELKNNDQNRDKDKNKIDVVIHCKAMNPAGQQKDPDKVLADNKVLLTVYQGGIRLDLPDKNFIPEDSNSVPMKSFLVYRSALAKGKEPDKWTEAFKHTGRIHFFELQDVSAEKGICLNDPLPNTAKTCRDLLVKNEDKHEAFNDNESGKAANCNTAEYFLEARTQKPERQYSVKVHSEDFGSFGKLRSFANAKNRGQKEPSPKEAPYYIPVPMPESELKHPDAKRKKVTFKDNTVAIPLDVDGNKIHDNGWLVIENNQRVADPPDNDIDPDGAPAGDGYKGDGLTHYEEYRGFKVAQPSVRHIRTNYNVKDLFIVNPDNLPTGGIAPLTALHVHIINADQCFDRPAPLRPNLRIVNFNGTSFHLADQSALLIRDRGTHATFLGFCSTSVPGPGQRMIDDETLSPPNWVLEVKIYTTSIANFSTQHRLNNAAKLRMVIHHETCHGMNIYHHGEGNTSFRLPDPRFYDKLHGLRSGNVSCVMRYDNVGTPVPGTPLPEAVGTILCNSVSGTGYNTPDTIRRQGNRPPQINQNWYGNADERNNRGACTKQLRVSGVDIKFPRRD